MNPSASLAGFLVSLLMPAAAAQDPCTGISGCAPTDVPLLSFIPVIVSLMVDIAAGLSVVFVVIGGAQMMLNFGNESTAQQGRMSVVYALIGFALTLSAQAIVSFVVARVQGVSAQAPHLEIMNLLVRSMLFVFNVTFALVTIFFGFRLVLSRGNQSELDSAKTGMTWTVIGAIAVNLAYALVQATAFLGF